MPDAPFAIEPAVGWRAWHVVETDEGLRLTSVVFREVVWPAREEMVAEHRGLMYPHEDGVYPKDGCYCGIYARKNTDWTKLRGYLGSFTHAEGVVWRVAGRVKLWGRLIEGDDGWRAEKAYPAELVVPSELKIHIAYFDDRGIAHPWEARYSPEDVAVGLSDAYGVPVNLFEGDTESYFESLNAEGGP